MPQKLANASKAADGALGKVTDGASKARREAQDKPARGGGFRLRVASLLTVLFAAFAAVVLVLQMPSALVVLLGRDAAGGAGAQRARCRAYVDADALRRCSPHERWADWTDDLAFAVRQGAAGRAAGRAHIRRRCDGAARARWLRRAAFSHVMLTMFTVVVMPIFYVVGQSVYASEPIGIGPIALGILLVVCLLLIEAWSLYHLLVIARALAKRDPRPHQPPTAARYRVAAMEAASSIHSTQRTPATSWLTGTSSVAYVRAALALPEMALITMVGAKQRTI